MIRLVNVKKGFNMGRPNQLIAVDDATLSIEERSITVLRGPSGSGKTTILSLLGCMARPTEGRIFVPARGNGIDATVDGGPLEIEVTSLPERFLTDVRRRTFGFIFQQLNLIRGITVLENIMLPAYPSQEPYRALRRRGLALLQFFKLQDRAGSMAERLSGGEAQRVAIARALINDPPFIIADEPTAHLDSTLSEDLMENFGRLRRDGKTVILASHDPLVFGSPLVDRVISIKDGRVEGRAE